MNKKLTLKELIWIGTGHVIGAGVVSIVGSALARTGYSVWLAFIVACILSFIRILPVIFFNSAVTVEGGRYGMITKCAGMKYGGLITLSSLLNWSARGTAVLALSKYISEFIPFINSSLFTLVIWLSFCIANLYGLDMMSRIQSFATPVLLSALGLFSFLAVINTQKGYLDFSSPLMFTGGKKGFFTAVVLLSYSCDGIASLANYSTKCVNPKRNIPLSMFMVSVITTVIYVAVSFASGAVLPLKYTANSTLIVTARKIMTPLTFNLFVICGPVFALLTTMNAGIPDSILPVMAGVREGWLPSFLAKQNKYGAYYIATLIIFIIGSLPVILGFSVSDIASTTIFLGGLSAVLIIISAVNFPFKFKTEWQKSKLYIPNLLYFSVVILCAVTELFMVIKAINGLDFKMKIVNSIITFLCFVYGMHKFKDFCE